MIWEPVVDTSLIDRNVFVTVMEIHLPEGGMVETGYGARVRRLEPEIMIGNIERAGLTVIEEDRMEHRYFLRARKE